MNTVSIIVIVVAVIVVAGVLSWTALRLRSRRLEQKFGPEYDRAIKEAGGRRSAESELREREKRRERLELHSLPDETRERYRDEWNGIQQRFVDVPGQAVRDADELVTRIMQDEGYPVDDFEQRAADLSVEHPDVVQRYRAAHSIAVQHQRGQAETEQLREGVTSYRELVDVLLEDRPGGSPTGSPTDAQSRTDRGSAPENPSDSDQ